MAFPDKSVYVWFCQITTCILWLGINFVFCANREPQKRPFDLPKVQEKACNEADNGAVCSDDSRKRSLELLCRIERLIWRFYLREKGKGDQK